MGRCRSIPSQPVTGTIHQSTTEPAILSGEGRQTGQSPYSLTTVGVTVDSIRYTQKSWCSCGIAASEINDSFYSKARDLCGTFRRELHDTFQELIPTEC